MGDSKDNHRRQNLVEISHLKKYFPVRGGLLNRVQGWIRAVDDVSFNIRRGETLSLVGESGCGKTTVGLTILRLMEATEGNVIFDGRDVFGLSMSDLKKIRSDMQIIFQDPYSSLDPRHKVGNIVAEALKIHGVDSAKVRLERAVEILEKVGLEASHASRYPFQFSGGQRQRIGIARALALQPKFLICDEPVSALDVSIRAQILNLLKDLQEEFELTYLFIAHDMSVVEHISDRVAVMYMGKIVEVAPTDELFRNPLHPYTQALMSAIPIPRPNARRDRIILRGDVPSSLHPPSGCRFHTRCPVAMDHCSEEEPQLLRVGPDHHVACWLVE